MEYFYLWVIGIGATLAMIFTLKAVFGYITVRADAQADFDYKTKEGMVDSRLSREAYVRAYTRYNAPRSTAYIGGTFWAILLLTYPALAVIQFVLDKWWVATGRSDVIHPGYLVWQFFIFFSVIALWASIAYSSARYYHRKTMISLERELEKELAQSDITGRYL